MYQLFSPGPVPEAALVVLECLDPYRTTITTWYRVRYDCCGAEGLLLHRSIMRRIEHGSYMCRDCGRRARVEDPPGFVMPPWPVASRQASPYLRDREPEFYTNQC